MAGKSENLEDEFPYYWNLDPIISRLVHVMRGLFFYTGTKEPIQKMIYLYSDWLDNAYNRKHLHIKGTPTEVSADLTQCVNSLLVNHRVCEQYFVELLEDPQVSKEVKIIINNVYNNNKIMRSLGESDE
eukprot:TRINITY_DN5862_c0_g1_i2.p2 TRINITY_DN5862_c0_g1~~TRINITY_DN5862_c0_g1_i2.p2  ORF type:complete len:129 (+),score=22.70 TRINITY_DN5862_c0_g1_i2:553-939(+)